VRRAHSAAGVAQVRSLLPRQLLPSGKGSHKITRPLIACFAVFLNAAYETWMTLCASAYEKAYSKADTLPNCRMG
jgi:hypothetical protein